jgi:hypothetical protein
MQRSKQHGYSTTSLARSNCRPLRCAASGKDADAATPPIILMNSRRLMC